MAKQELLVAEWQAVLSEAFTRLPPSCQQLKSRLIEGPPVPYAQINAKVGIAVRSIGSHRSRCLDKMRRDPAIAPLLGVDASSARGKVSRQAAVKR